MGMDRAGVLRRADRAMTPGEVEHLLEESPVGRLGTCAGGLPYVKPVNYLYRGGRVYFHGAPQGHAMDNLRRNPRVCFEVDRMEAVIPKARSCDYSVAYSSVVAFGSARLVERDDEKREILAGLSRKYSGGFDPLPPGPGDLAGVAVVEVSVETVTGKRRPAPPGAD